MQATAIKDDGNTTTGRKAVVAYNKHADLFCRGGQLAKQSDVSDGNVPASAMQWAGRARATVFHALAAQILTVKIRATPPLATAGGGG